MNTTSPIARGVRTFLVAVAGFAATWATLDWAGDPVTSATLLGLNLATAAVAGAAAFFLAYQDVAATSIVGRAFATFAQVVGSGILALTFNSIADLAANGRIILTTLISALFAAVGSLAMIGAESGGAPVPTPDE